MKKDELKILLLFYGWTKGTINGKQGSIPSVHALRKLYVKERELNNPPSQFEKWTKEDEAKLNRLKDISSMTLMDTAVGRHKQNLVIESKQMYTNMSQEEKDKFNRDLEVIDMATVDDRASV